MFAFECLLATVYLIVISIIHHVHAPDPESVEICRSLIKDRTYFLDTEDSGPVNFVIAFKFVSLKQIYNRFKAPVNHETEQEKNKRTLQHYLIKSYFLDLSFNHGINVSHLKTPDQWCTERLSQVNYNPEIYTNEIERIADCLEFTTKLLKSDETQPPLIFQRMYEDWSDYELIQLTWAYHYIHNQYFANQSEKDFFEKKLQYSVKTYSEAYFRHYEEVVNNLDPTKGKFRSIRQYCEKLVKIMKISL